MTSELDQRTSWVETLAALRGEVATLADRVAALESSVARQPMMGAAQTGAESSNGAPRASDESTPEIVAVIAAVLAAHLGVRPHIRQISLAGGGAWAQQGRVTIQASHALAIQRD